MRAFNLVAIAVAASVLAAGPALAHTKVVNSNPAPGAAVAAPKVISLTFSEKVAPAFTGFDLTMVDHNMKVPVKTKLSKDGKTLSGAPQGALMKGAYKVNWHAAGADGHRMTGEIAFQVN